MEILDYQKKIEKLERENFALKSQMLPRYYFAKSEIDKLTQDNYNGSSFILTISSLSGKDLIEPVCLFNGFSDKTIQCLKEEIIKSYNFKTEIKL